jgi:hypothetical protein
MGVQSIDNRPLSWSFEHLKPLVSWSSCPAIANKETRISMFSTMLASLRNRRAGSLLGTGVQAELNGRKC